MEKSPKTSGLSIGVEDEFREKLIMGLKKEVKNVMEEAVTRKFIHEDSSSVTSLCAALESCILYGLKKRSVGLFGCSNSLPLFQKLSAECPAAKIVCDNMTTSMKSPKSESILNFFDSNRKSPSPKMPRPNCASTSRYYWLRSALSSKNLIEVLTYLTEHSSKYYDAESIMGDKADGLLVTSLLIGPSALEFSKVKSNEFICDDPSADELLQRHRIHCSTTGRQISNSVSPNSPRVCNRPALCVQSRCSPGAVAASNRVNFSTSSDESASSFGISNAAREYVESLHQNNRSTLLYGKNNVHVQPLTLRDGEPLPGYLSLHQAPQGLFIKWTPNQLMQPAESPKMPDRLGSDGSADSKSISSRSSADTPDQSSERSVYWEYAMCIPITEIVYIHCHQQPSGEGTVVLVGADGIQCSPIHMPKGGHLISFLSCLENALLPHGQLDPPLWSQRGKGKVFPKLMRTPSRPRLLGVTLGGSKPGSPRSPQPTKAMSTVSEENEPSTSACSSPAPEPKAVNGTAAAAVIENKDDLNGKDDEGEETTDYVFRVIIPDQLMRGVPIPTSPGPASLFGGSTGLPQLGDSFFNQWIKPPFSTLHQQPTGASCGYARSVSLADTNPVAEYAREKERLHRQYHAALQHRSSIRQLCDTMKWQIISRAFYGWLAYCRHLKTVRTHLSGLIFPLESNAIPKDDCITPDHFSQGISAELWNQGICNDGVVSDSARVFGLVYHGGITDDNLRKEIWPYLLNHYPFGSSRADRAEIDLKVAAHYEQIMSECCKSFQEFRQSRYFL